MVFRNYTRSNFGFPLLSNSELRSFQIDVKYFVSMRFGELLKVLKK